MWLHLFTSNTGAVRVPSLKNHYVQNNDFLKTILPETYLPPHQRLSFLWRLLRFIVAVPLLLLMAVAALNSVNEKETYDLCLQRDECLTYCERDNFPALICNKVDTLTIKYAGNEYNEFYYYPDTASSSGFNTCRKYQEDNRDYPDSVHEDRQWRVHTCFNGCNNNSDDNFEIDGRTPCSGSSANALWCVYPDEACEDNQWADEECLEGDTCYSISLIFIAILIANFAQLLFEGALYYTLSISFKPTELDLKLNPNREDDALKTDKDPPCNKILKKCAGEMLASGVMIIGLIVAAVYLVASYQYGRPNTIWFEWLLALLIDQGKSVILQPVIWWLVVRRCGQLQANFDTWKVNEQLLEGIQDESFLDEMRQYVAKFMQSKPVTYFIIGLVVFYAVFILANLSVDPYIENEQEALDFFYYVDLALLLFFLTEIGLRFFAWAFGYLCEVWNFIDAVVVIVSFVFSILRLEVKGIAVLRLLRLIRVVIVMRRVSESKKKLLQLRNQNTSVSSNVTRVLDILEEIQKDKSIPRALKQDLAWLIEMVKSRKLYISSGGLNDDKDAVNEYIKAYRHLVKDDYEDFENDTTANNYGGKDRVLKRARMSAADFKLFSVEYFSERINALFLTPSFDQEPVERSKLEEMEEAIDRIDEWSWDLMKYYSIAENLAFPFLCLRLFIRHDVYRTYEDLSLDKWQNFMSYIYQGYLFKNPYHRAEHILDTVQATHYFYRTAGFENFLTVQDIIIGFTAAFIHDYEHPGLTNQFLIRTKHPKAVRYSDCSPLENHHVAAAFKLMKSNEECDVFGHLGEEELRKVRKMLIYMVIHTDLAYHFELLNSIQAKILGESFPKETVEDRLMLLTFVLHCADISKPARSWYIYRMWIENMMEEFFLQGDMEKELGIPVSSFMDRENTNKERVHITYIDFIVKESIDILNILSPSPKYDNVIHRDLIENGININKKALQKKLEGEVKF